jgi:hypothetical protein
MISPDGTISILLKELFPYLHFVEIWIWPEKNLFAI